MQQHEPLRRHGRTVYHGGRGGPISLHEEDERNATMVLAEVIETRDIFRIAADQQVRIRRMNFRRDSLEDIFLKAMES